MVDISPYACNLTSTFDGFVVFVSLFYPFVLRYCATTVIDCENGYVGPKLA